MYNAEYWLGRIVKILVRSGSTSAIFLNHVPPARLVYKVAPIKHPVILCVVIQIISYPSLCKFARPQPRAARLRNCRPVSAFKQLCTARQTCLSATYCRLRPPHNSQIWLTDVFPRRARLTVTDPWRDCRDGVIGGHSSLYHSVNFSKSRCYNL